MKLPPNYQYIKMDYDDKEALYQEWCRQANLDPKLAYSVEEFFAAIDGIEEQAE